MPRRKVFTEKDFVKLKDFKWYVLLEDFNASEIINWNIFNSSNFKEGVIKLLYDFTTYEDFKKELRNELLYCFWSKAEYEIICSGLFAKEESEFFKVDVFSQVEPNLDILAHYIIYMWNNRKNVRNKLEI